MGKKKKTQLKPVARGFATTSVPSKKAVAEAESATNEEPPPEQGIVDEGATGSNITQGAANPEVLSRELAQEQSLQALVDKFQDKTERDIGRTLKVRKTG